MNTISAFQGEYRFLSNFWPCHIDFEGLIYPSTEHAYQASKVSSPDVKIEIRDCPTPADAKEYFTTKGIKPGIVKTKNEKMIVMERLLRSKFSGKEPFLVVALLDTGNAEIVEGNNWGDTFWGVCNGTGENYLGRLLMKTRQRLLDEKEFIFRLLRENYDNLAIAKKMRLGTRELYEKMISFQIRNEGFWIG